MAQAIPTPIIPTTRRKARRIVARTIAAPDDPIFAAIERHRWASADYVASTTCMNALEERSAEWKHANAENCRDAAAETAAFTALLTTAPTTLAGVAAVLEYANSKEWPDDHSGAGRRNTIIEGGYNRGDHALEATQTFLTMIARTQRKLLAA
jgi:hypothetical protein